LYNRSIIFIWVSDATAFKAVAVLSASLLPVSTWRKKKFIQLNLMANVMSKPFEIAFD
jgi:hypothetical protein